MEAFGQFYFMSITMIFGSLVAGLHPGGRRGRWHFRSWCFSSNFSAEDGRDFSLMIQSVAGFRRAFHLFFFNLFHVFPGLWEDDAIFIYIMYICIYYMYIYIYIYLGLVEAPCCICMHLLHPRWACPLPAS